MHTNESPIAETWAVPTRLAGAALVWHEHGIAKPSRLHESMQRLARRVICVSKFTAAHLSPALKDRCAVIHNPFAGCDTRIDRAAARRRIGAETDMPGDLPVVGFCAMLTRQKRPDVFVDAAARIAAGQGGAVRFLIIGDDREGLRPQLDKRIRTYGIHDLVHFAGWRDDAIDLISACDLLLAPAVGEGFGRAVVEAMLVGTPVIAADSGGHREILESGLTGILVPPDDSETMSGMALDLLADPARAATLAKAARAEASAAYDADRHAAAVAAIYDEVLFARSQPSSMQA